METLNLTPDARQFMQRFKLIIPSRRQGDIPLTFAEKVLFCGLLLLSGLWGNAFASVMVWVVLFKLAACFTCKAKTIKTVRRRWRAMPISSGWFNFIKRPAALFLPLR